MPTGELRKEMAIPNHIVVRFRVTRNIEISIKYFEEINVDRVDVNLNFQKNEDDIFFSQKLRIYFSSKSEVHKNLL